MPTSTLDNSPLEDDDVVLADLRNHRKKLHVKNPKVLTEMKNELLVLLQSAESELET